LDFEDDGKIVAADRLALLENLEDTHQDLNGFELPLERPFGFFSRCAVHPLHRKKGYAQLLDCARIKFIKEKNIPFTMAFCFNDRISSLEKIGFKKIGNIEYDFDAGSNEFLNFCVYGLGEVRRHN